MATDKQIAANRLNAQSRTGPRSPEGKAISALNARTHGLTSNQLLTPFEDQDALVKLSAALHQQYHPQSETESILVEQMIAATWRLHRVRRIETRHYVERAEDLVDNRGRRADPCNDVYQVFRDDCNGPHIVDTLGRHESRLERSFYRALKELERIQSRRSPTPSTTSEELGSICKITNPATSVPSTGDLPTGDLSNRDSNGACPSGKAA